MYRWSRYFLLFLNYHLNLMYQTSQTSRQFRCFLKSLMFRNYRYYR
jgi:hypothetical protein